MKAYASTVRQASTFAIALTSTVLVSKDKIITRAMACWSKDALAKGS
jgi:hypothetical protein